METVCSHRREKVRVPFLYSPHRIDLQYISLVELFLVGTQEIVQKALHACGTMPELFLFVTVTEVVL
jgi:hypothetical protein